VDVPALVKEAQEEYVRVLHTFNTPAEYTQYWERTSARQWLTMINIARKFKLPSNLHMLRMIRATLLYDSIVLRLDNQLNRYDEYMEFMKDLAQLVKQKWRKRLKDSAGDEFFLNVEESGKTFNDLLLRTQSVLGKPIVNLGSTINKWIFSASVLIRLAGRILFITILAVIGVRLWHAFAGESISIGMVLNLVIQNRLYQAFLIVAMVINLRHIIFRLREPEG
jgi:hypothetical protein